MRQLQAAERRRGTKDINRRGGRGGEGLAGVNPWRLRGENLGGQCAIHHTIHYSIYQEERPSKA